MATKIAINGFGRIGRCVARIALNDPDIELVAVNDLADAKSLGLLFKYDSVHGTYPGEVTAEEDCLTVDGKKVKVFSSRDPAELPWGELGVDIVIESTGFFRQREDAAKHLAAGAKRVVISAPGKDVDLTMCMGVNHTDFDPSMEIVDTASCTTNCLAPVAKVLQDAFGIESGLMTTVHAYTTDQRLLDTPHKDMRRARAAAVNMVPTSTGAAIAVARVLPELEGKLNGMAIRVPTSNVSCIDLTVNLSKDTDVETINKVFKEAAEGPLKGILGYSDLPLVSSDFIGNPNSSTFDAPLTMSLGDRFFKIVSWYDNEWGFSNRMVDAVKYIAANS